MKSIKKIALIAFMVVVGVFILAVLNFRDRARIIDMKVCEQEHCQIHHLYTS